MFKHLSFFLLRRPLRPIHLLYQFHQQVSERSFALCLRDFYKNDALAQEAIYFASPDLYDRFVLWLAGKDITECDQLQSTLYKYLVRLCTRCTPFGLFAGCTTGEITISSNFLANRKISQHTRFTIDTLTSIRDWIIAQPNFRKQLKLNRNTTLYAVGDSYRYIEIERKGSNWEYFLTYFEKDEFIDLVIKSIQPEGATIEELVRILVSVGVSAQYAHSFVENLIESEILVFDLEPSVIGDDALKLLIQRLKSFKNSNELVVMLTKFYSQFSESADRANKFENMRRQLNEIGILSMRGSLTRTDMFFADQVNKIDSNIIDGLQKQLSLLSFLTEFQESKQLTLFKKTFKERYNNEEVALSVALDPDFGIGYGSNLNHPSSHAPIINDIFEVYNKVSELNSDDSWWQKYLFEKINNAIYEGCDQIEINDEDILALSKIQPQNLSPSNRKYTGYGVCCMGNLLADSVEELEKGNYLFNLTSFGGVSAISVMSRFSEGDINLKEHLKDFIKEEVRFSPDVIFAELVYCPSSNLGNILTRSSLYYYEMPYLGRSSLPQEQQISIDDLFISINNNEIILKSKKLNSRIIPKSTNAHNYHSGLPLYRFLCDLQQVYSSGNIHWDWGRHRDKPFLPRVKYKNIILSRASWLLDPINFKGLSLADAVIQLRLRDIPVQFILASGDNELLIDTGFEPALQILLKEISKGKPIRVFEVLQSAENCLIRDEQQGYTNEIVIPFINKHAIPIPGLKSSCSILPQGNFLLGSEWLYLKIYTGEESADRILIKTLAPVIEELLKNKTIDKFFFVRFKDPSHHLRIRFHGTPDSFFYLDVFRIIQVALSSHVKSGEVNNIQVDSYNRELDRYGINRIEICESIFYWDSVKTLEFLCSSDSRQQEANRLSFALRRINLILEYSGISSEEKLFFLNHLKEEFFKEFKGDTQLRKRLGSKYRELKEIVSQELNMEFIYYKDPFLPILSDVFLRINDRNTLFSFISSIVHMTVNRIFSSRQRVYELVLYHILYKQFQTFQKHGQSLKI
ncbi:lantibiotic dehydratase [Dyadobacter sp. CY345]|uniref:lantibiotic dehydratase n=1 Tax=Dyadobacter sp. CY345 TaxID=2909335 RepID=UPI001F2F704A|nr:lantibiotic dehydratase [Dyadobacter sp. CY345]MCF2446949.1 lantibiotic dehydratase [Dyadobacter sp. CY345]